MFMCRLIGIAVALTIIVGCSARENSGDVQEPTRSYHTVKDESSARHIVKKYAKDNNIDISGLEFAFARRMDTTDKATPLPTGFGSEIWVVRYAPVQKQGEMVTLGGGLLFWIDAVSGKVQMKRERD
jgi:hypothetical protein